jgi:hypothetical protein
MTDAPFRIRDARPSDRAFVSHAWVESYRARLMSKVEKEISKLVHGSRVLVACDNSDDDLLLGFVSMSDRALHYAYVKEPLRGEGIARALIGSEPIDSYTFRTDAGISRIRPAERGWEYRPRIIP